MSDEAIMSREKIVALAIDDDEGELEILSRYVEDLVDFDVSLHRYCEADKAFRDLCKLQIDVIFLDYQLGSETGVEVLEKLRGMGDLRPVIVLTGHGDEYAAARITRAGADDYIVKSDLNSEILNRSIRLACSQYQRRMVEAQALEQAEELKEVNERLELAQSELEAANKRLRDLSNTDYLTGIPNRRYFMTRLEKELHRLERHPADVSLVMIDVDYFKKINDAHGHMVGDQVLVALTEVFHESVRSYDVAARIGGEEFAILLPNTSLDDGMIVAERYRRAVEAMRLPIKNHCLQLTISAGVSCCPDGGASSVDSLMLLADAALYRAKSKGRNCVIAAS